MAVTQYIGSRYVPLFADPVEWSAQNTYEPLTIVLHEGNSYTSKQAVPKGVDINNEAFWALTGNYNAQVESYRQEVYRVRNSIIELQSKDTELETAITGEATARENADDELSTAIENETNSRESADREIETSINELSSRIDDVEKITIRNIDAIPNGKIEFQVTPPQTRIINNEVVVVSNQRNNSLQGCTPFSLRNDYSYDSDSIYFACVMGTDAQRFIDIFNTDGIRVGTLDLTPGHYGCITYDNDGHLYTMNYTNGTVDYQKLIEIDVSVPQNPRITNKYTANWQYAGSINFWHKNKMCVGKIVGNTTVLYDWDLNNNTYTYFATINRDAYGTASHLMAHYTYDEYSDTIIWIGQSPSGMVLYDSDGSLIKAVPISDMINFANVGEIEEIVVYGEHIWFFGQVQISNNLLNFGTSRRIGCYYFNIKTKIQNNFMPSSNHVQAIVNPTESPAGKNDTFMSDDSSKVASMQPIFKYYEDAVNYVNYCHNNGVGRNDDFIHFIGDYPWCAITKDLCGCYIGAHGTEPAKVAGIAFINCTTVQYTTSICAYDENEYLKYGDKPTLSLMSRCSNMIPLATGTPTDDYWNLGASYSEIVGQTLSYAYLNRTFARLYWLNYSTVTTYSQVLAQGGNTDCTASDHSYIGKMTV